MAVSAIANLEHTLAAAVANAATFTVPYPAGTTQAILTGSTGGQLVRESGETYLQGTGAGTIALAFGASNITVTNNTGNALPAAAKLYLSFGEVDINGSYNLTNPKKVQDRVNALPAT